MKEMADPIRPAATEKFADFIKNPKILKMGYALENDVDTICQFIPGLDGFNGVLEFNKISVDGEARVPIRKDCTTIVIVCLIFDLLYAFSSRKRVKRIGQDFQYILWVAS